MEPTGTPYEPTCKGGGLELFALKKKERGRRTQRNRGKNTRIPQANAGRGERKK